ncbi:MAG: UDP-N-acetylglucosamine 2-epimerase (non-hydrolyzing) [Chloroflexi bacterium]|nr:UDP-N-acetylglucosamine 2-epimerase (non-hydrolyzing) [Chloroflexota bacterium]
MAPVVRELHKQQAYIRSWVCVTAQHRDMLDQVLDLFGIVPDVDLDIMQPGQNPSQVAARVLTALDPVLEDLQPDWLLVQGDTTTVLAAATAAHYRRVKVGHVEAGLRTGDRANPFPEEMNRVVTDHIADMHFAPTGRARQNLLREGIRRESIHVTGNTVIDALLWVAVQPTTPEINRLFDQLGIAEQGSRGAGEQGSRGASERGSEGGFPSAPPHPGPSAPRLILVTAHRRENFGVPLRDICAALREIARRDDVCVVYPVHRNPHVWEPVHVLLGDVPRIHLIPPVDYLTLAHLMKRSAIILTDSGGIQEEAPGLGVPVLVLRQTTERPEVVEAGAARIVGTDPSVIAGAAQQLLDEPAVYASMARAVNPYGDGHAAEHIVRALRESRFKV